jgi:sugar/nucleoside kinase (ribokinase family)
LYGLTQGWSHQRAGDLASAASAKLVTSLGPRISRDDSQDILSTFL